MKQIACEMCGGTDLIKQDGVFVCQNCGMKYSVEEAKKMMVEGTVKIDESSKADNYLQMAQNAYEATNYSEAELYCNKTLEINSENSDALYLKGVAAAWQSTLAVSRLEEFYTCFSNALKFENDPEKLFELASKACNECCSLYIAMLDLKLKHLVSFPSQDDCKEIHSFIKSMMFAPGRIQIAYGTRFNNWKIGKPEYENQTPKSVSEGRMASLFLLAKQKVHDASLQLWDEVLNEYNKEKYPTVFLYDRAVERGSIAIVLMDIAIPKDLSGIDTYTDEEKELTISTANNLITMYTTFGELKAYEVSFTGGSEHYNVVKSKDKKAFADDIRNYHIIINKCDPSHVIPEVPKAASSGCYVATCVYGSYDCPQVWTLRRYRDYTLAKTWHGRAFIKTYYAISPTLVKWFGHTEWFKKMWQGKLDRMVANLQANGVEDTPYKDKEW